MTDDHATSCLCPSCAPISLPTRSPSLQSAGTAEVDFDLAQMVSLFRQLDPDTKRLALAMVGAAVKMQGKRG